jgi:hypothetical protein
MWFVGFERQLQQRLWTSLEQFEATCPGYVKRIEWDLVLANPREAVQELAEFAALDPSAHELERAEQFVRHE